MFYIKFECTYSLILYYCYFRRVKVCFQSNLPSTVQMKQLETQKIYFVADNVKVKVIFLHNNTCFVSFTKEALD